LHKLFDNTSVFAWWKKVWKKTGKVFPPQTQLGAPSLEDVLKVKDFRDRRLNMGLFAQSLETDQ
jgi:hypothetical protein